MTTPSPTSAPACAAGDMDFHITAFQTHTDRPTSQPTNTYLHKPKHIHTRLLPPPPALFPVSSTHHHPTTTTTPLLHHHTRHHPSLAWPLLLSTFLTHTTGKQNIKITRETSAREQECQSKRERKHQTVVHPQLQTVETNEQIPEV